nr:MAG TPA: hypothetical protein [Bacteriophage sp.]
MCCPLYPAPFCRLAAILPQNSRKHAYFTPFALFWYILPRIQEKRPHSRNKPAMQPLNIKAN